MLIPELIYYFGYLIKSNIDLMRQKRLHARVISVGNLTVGGTGKTPAVISLAKEAKRRGYYPVILTRGYRGKAKGPCLVSKGNGPLIGPDMAGDEAFLMAQRLEDIPVIKSPDRYRGGCLAIRTFQHSDRIVFILDDGYQHLRLHRDLDILLIDGSNPFGNRRLLPAGRLREPLREIKRADIIVITRSAVPSEELVKEIRIYNGYAPIFCSQHVISAIHRASGRAIRFEDISGKRAIAFCGIGNPESFRKGIKEVGIDLRDFIVFRDHHTLTVQDLKRIRRSAEIARAEWIITTEKDIIKVRDSGTLPELLYLLIDFKVDERFYEEVFKRL